MMEDDILREIRAFRDEYARQFGYDIAAMGRDLREQQRTCGRQVVSFPPRRPSKNLLENNSGSAALETESRTDESKIGE